MTCFSWSLGVFGARFRRELNSLALGTLSAESFNLRSPRKHHPFVSTILPENVRGPGSWSVIEGSYTRITCELFLCRVPSFLIILPRRRKDTKVSRRSKDHSPCISNQKWRRRARSNNECGPHPLMRQDHPLGIHHLALGNQGVQINPRR